MTSQNPQYIQEDEIDLRELFNTILNHKKFVIVFTSVVTLLAVIYVYSKTPIYEVKSNIQVGFIGKNFIEDPNIITKTLRLVFNVDDKSSLKEILNSEVVDIKQNKKLKNFIEIKTQGVSNDLALQKNKEIVKYLQDKYLQKIDKFKENVSNSIKTIEFKLNNLKNYEYKNIKDQIKYLKTQELLEVDDQIQFYKETRSQTKKIELRLILMQKIKELQNKKADIVSNGIKKLEYKLNIELPIKERDLKRQIEDRKSKTSKFNLQNSKVIGQYIIKDYPVKPKKRLIVIVAFVTGFILSIFLVFFIEFVKNTKEKE
jgi:LPS O-antigen subunit length determinant protein (WzzB/FepE family)